MNRAVRLALANYAVFNGRTKRADFWFYYLFSILLNIPTTILDDLLFGGHAYISNLAGIFLFIPLLSAAVRRMHDVDKRGWWLLVPFANLFFLVQPSGPMNRFDVII